MNAKEIERLYRHSQLKVGIVRALNRFKGSHYQNQIRFYFSSYADDEFLAVVEEMVNENTITRTKGKMGGTILQVVVRNSAQANKEATNG